MLAAEHLSCPPEAVDDFVRYQENTVLIADGADGGTLFRHRRNTAAAHHWFADKCTHAFRALGLDLLFKLTGTGHFTTDDLY